VTTIVWLVQTAWFSVINSAIEKLPLQDGGELRSGALKWLGDSTQILDENRFLALTIDLKHEGGARSPAHVQVEFGQRNMRLVSVFGSWQGAYPRSWVITINRLELKPWWGAWAPSLLAVAGGIALAGLMVIWAVLASIYCWAAWLVAFFKNRVLGLAG